MPTLSRPGRRKKPSRKAPGPADLLIIFAKAPVSGIAKTRLFPHLSFDEAAEVQKAFLSDTIDKVLAVSGIGFCLAYTPEWSLEVFRGLYGDRFLEYYPQEGADLGQRMARAFECAFGRGVKKAVVVGTDIPEMPVHYLCASYRRLDEADVVLGPALDGGYYLVGLKRPAPGLFDGIAWSGPDVFKQTVSRAKSLGLKVSCLPVVRDVDTFEDLRCLLGGPLPPHTRRLVSALEFRLNRQSDWLT